SRKAFDGFRDSPYYQGKMDLWYGFACKMIDFLKEDGIECFIAQNNWITSSGASKFRDKVLSDTTIKLFTDFNDYKVFKSAGIQTMIYILTKVKTSNTHKVKYSILKDQNVNGDQLKKFLDFNSDLKYKSEKYLFPFNKTQFNDGFITFNNPEQERILKIIYEIGDFFLYEHEITQGIVAPQDKLNKKNADILGTGFHRGDGIFNLSKEELDSLELGSREMEIVKPFYSTEHLKKYFKVSDNQEWIIYTNSSANKWINDFPKINSHLNKFRDVITSDFAPYGLHRSRNESFFKGNKILSLRKCQEPTFTYSDFECYVSQTYNLINSERIDLKYLTGLLNSKLIKFWLKNRGKLQGELFQVDKEPLINIPILFSNNLEMLRLVEYIIQLIKTNHENIKLKIWRVYFEQIIDGIVYDLYFPDLLKKHDRQIIRYLGELAALKDSMSDQEKLAICKQVFERLNDKEHPVRKNLFRMDSIPEISIIEGKDDSH
ncbi:MAG: hypothetical protein OXH57_01300, partial [Ekhidna sp.]|nr:hypothetical protein [Ekhidna sp.]